MKRSLAIDLGNSRLKAGVFSGKELLEQFVFKEDYTNNLDKICIKYQIESGILSNSGLVSLELEAWIKARQFKKLEASTPLPIAIDYETPNTLGLDRRCNAVAGFITRKNKKQSCLVIDLGTCITYDYLSAKGEFEGGAISPGWQMRMKAMHNFTEKLPLVEHRAVKSGVQKSTKSCLQAGGYYGILYEMEGMIAERIAQNPNLFVVITGGDASYFEKALKYPIFADQNLTLRGLNEILLHNS